MFIFAIFQNQHIRFLLKFLLWAFPFRGDHSESPASIKPSALHPLLTPTNLIPFFTTSINPLSPFSFLPFLLILFMTNHTVLCQYMLLHLFSHTRRHSRLLNPRSIKAAFCRFAQIPNWNYKMYFLYPFWLLRSTHFTAQTQSLTLRKLDFFMTVNSLKNKS